MSNDALRPSFWLPLDVPAQQAADRFESALAQADHPVVVQRAGLHMTLTVGPALRHFWSPWMNLDFGHRSPEAGGSPEAVDASVSEKPSATVYARFSPAPSIWTGFMLLYVSLGALAFFALIFAAAQWMLEAVPTMLWGALVCAAAWAGLWWVSWVGQKLAHRQMLMLREILEKELAASGDSRMSGRAV